MTGSGRQGSYRQGRCLKPFLRNRLFNCRLGLECARDRDTPKATPRKEGGKTSQRVGRTRLGVAQEDRSGSFERSEMHRLQGIARP
jgi:hypothetical protein